MARNGAIAEMDRIAVRRAASGDVRAIEELAARSVRTLHVGAYDAAIIDEAIAHAYGVDWQLIRDGTYFVATMANAIVGAGGWSYRQTIAGAHGPEYPPARRLLAGEEAARLRAFYVDPGWIRHGIGGCLLHVSEQASAAAGFTRAELTATLPATPFYAGHGYQPAGSYDLVLPSGRRLNLCLMTKRLRLSL